MYQNYCFILITPPPIKKQNIVVSMSVGGCVCVSLC